MLCSIFQPVSDHYSVYNSGVLLRQIMAVVVNIVAWGMNERAPPHATRWRAQKPACHMAMKMATQGRRWLFQSGGVHSGIISASYSIIQRHYAVNAAMRNWLKVSIRATTRTIPIIKLYRVVPYPLIFTMSDLDISRDSQEDSRNDGGDHTQTQRAERTTALER